MSSTPGTPQNHPVQWTHPDLQTLVDLFYDDPVELGTFTETTRGALPDVYNSLLAHHEHMTVSMENHHRCPVNVEVLDKRATDTHYAREIVLKRSTDQVVVQYGIVRLNTQFLGAHVREEILAETKPLGRILIQHDVLRTVKLMTLWRIEPGKKMKAALGQERLQLCYGRTALIYTNGIPAVELFEVAVDV